MRYEATNDITKFHECRDFIRKAAEIAGMEPDSYFITPTKYSNHAQDVIGAVGLKSTKYNIDFYIGGYSRIDHIESRRGSHFQELNEFDLKTAKNLANKIKQYMARAEIVKYR